MKLITTILLLSSLQSPDKVVLTYSGNDSTICIGVFNKSCMDSVAAGLKDSCGYVDYREVKKFK
jgi:hypothetical protein